MEGRRDNQTADGQREKTGCSLSYRHVEILLHTVHSSHEEGHSHDQQQVGQYASDQRGLYNDNLILEQRKDRHNQLNGVAKIYR